MSWPSEDDLSPRFAITQLLELGLGTQQNIAKAFGIHEKSVFNYRQTFSAKGAYGLVPEKSGPKGSWKLDASLRSKILCIALKEGIFECEEIKRKLDARGEHVSIPSIRQVLLENGIIDRVAVPHANLQQGGLFDFPDKDQMHLDFGVAGEIAQKATEKRFEGEEETSSEIGTRPGPAGTWAATSTQSFSREVRLLCGPCLR